MVSKYLHENGIPVSELIIMSAVEGKEQINALVLISLESVYRAAPSSTSHRAYSMSYVSFFLSVISYFS